MQAKERVHFPFLGQRRNQCIIRILILVLRQHVFRRSIVRFPVQRKFKVVDQVVMPGIEQGVVAQFFQLICKRLIQLIGMAAVVAISRTGIEQGVTTE